MMPAGEIVAMMEVLVLPPRESCSNLNRIWIEVEIKSPLSTKKPKSNSPCQFGLPVRHVRGPVHQTRDDSPQGEEALVDIPSLPRPLVHSPRPSDVLGSSQVDQVQLANPESRENKIINPIQ